MCQTTAIIGKKYISAIPFHICMKPSDIPISRVQGGLKQGLKVAHISGPPAAVNKYSLATFASLPFHMRKGWPNTSQLVSISIHGSRPAVK